MRTSQSQRSTTDNPPQQQHVSLRSAMIRYEGKCDICTKPDGSREHNLQKCRVCNVLVHELCYGMVPTNSKNADFVCHACKAVVPEEEGGKGGVIEVNVPSKVGGWVLRDVLAKEEGISSFREFLRDDGDAGAETKLDFCVAVTKFQNSEIDEDESDLWGDTLKSRAQNLFDAHCANDARKRVELPSNVIGEIESRIYDGDNESSSIAPSLFDAARRIVHQSLQNRKLAGYKQSAAYERYVETQRAVMRQEERPAECALCSVKNGIHAMHPLYDFDGKEGRQLCLPANGVGFMRKEKRLAWVHTLCAMFICSSGITGSLVYGCDNNGKWEGDDESDDEEEEDTAKRKVIDSDDEDEEKDQSRRLEEEQSNFTTCEGVFQPLMERLQESNTGAKEDVNGILECIDSMVDNAELLTPPFLQEYQIGRLIKGTRKIFDGTHPEVKRRCKILSAEMKRVYHEKEQDVPDGFKPVKNLGKDKQTMSKNSSRRNNAENGEGDESKTTGPAKNSTMENEEGNDSSEAIVDTNTNNIEPKYKIGTTLTKEFRNGKYAGEITGYDSESQLYHVKYEDGDSEDLTEYEVSHLLLSYTAWFCMAGPINGQENEASRRLKAHREFVCVICKKKDNASNKCLRIPVQCAAGDPSEFHEFKKYHPELNKQKRLARMRGEEHRGCAEPMHVGCARWGANYAKVKNKNIRMCYYFSGKPPTYEGQDEFQVPVSNCFCRKHAIEIQEGIAKSASKGGDGGGEGKKSDSSTGCKRKSEDVAKGPLNGDALSEQDESEEDSAEKARRLRIAIARKKKRRILEESDEESE